MDSLWGMTCSETHRVLVKKQETRNQDDTYDEILDDKLASEEYVKRHSPYKSYELYFVPRPVIALNGESMRRSFEKGRS